VPEAELHGFALFASFAIIRKLRSGETVFFSSNNRCETLSSSHSILVYLSSRILFIFIFYFYSTAQKTGKLLPDAKQDPAGNADVLQWLMWQMAGYVKEERNERGRRGRRGG
jgi:hypothetical protein